MYVPSAFHHRDGAAPLAELASPGPVPAGPLVLDGHRPAYAVARGEAELVAVRRGNCGRPRSGHVLARFGPGAVVPSSSALGAWQLALLPDPGAELRALDPRALRRVGFGGLADEPEPPDTLVPPQRAVSALAAALCRGLDGVLLAVADALRPGPPPDSAADVGRTGLVSLAAGSVLAGDGRVNWLRVAGGHVRRNSDPGAVFGAREPVLLAGRDWIVADGLCTVEALRTDDLLAAGDLATTLDQHAVVTLRTLDSLLTDLEPPTAVDRWPLAACARCSGGSNGFCVDLSRTR
jgi:hypothetical protein